MEHAELSTALIIDDHPLFCDALTMTLRTIAGIESIETANCLGQALEKVDSLPRPDVIVLDLNLPDVNGLDGREVFRAALDTVQRGETFVPDGYVDVSDTDDATTPAEEVIERLSLLTKQQSRILNLICEGRLNKQIAYELSIAETTVKAHVTAIMRKLGVQSRTQAVLIAQKANFANYLQS
mgnify:CR=1 FL=1